VNVNPLGRPEAVEEALYHAVKSCMKYPDIEAEGLREAVSLMRGIPQDTLLFGNGASELFMAIVHGIRPGKIMIPVPSFYGYEYAARAVLGNVCYYRTREEDFFRLTEAFWGELTEEVDLLFLANPNNPTGSLLSREYLRKLLYRCKEKDIYLVLDECFIDFCGKEHSMMSEIGQFDNLIIVQAFTKIFAVPGVRLGYLACSDQKLLEKIGRQLPEWNISSFAQEAGFACAVQEDFIRKTEVYVREERVFLTDHLKRMGLRVFPAEANFILIQSKQTLYEELLEQGILIRNCENFRGLGQGYFRIAVKSRKENEELLKALEQVIQKEGI